MLSSMQRQENRGGDDVLGKVRLWGTIGGCEDLWGYHECRPEKRDSSPGGRGLEVGGVRVWAGEEARQWSRGKSRKVFVFQAKIQSLYLKAVLELPFVSTSKTKFTS